jgi:hypothetical protein
MTQPSASPAGTARIVAELADLARGIARHIVRTRPLVARMPYATARAFQQQVAGRGAPRPILVGPGGPALVGIRLSHDRHLFEPEALAHLRLFAAHRFDQDFDPIRAARDFALVQAVADDDRALMARLALRMIQDA